MRTTPCDRAAATGRKRKAERFYADAKKIRDDGESGDSFVTLCVHAGIAAADAICCHALGEHARGEDHNEAVGLVKRVQPDGKELGKALQDLLSFKTRAGYSDEPVNAEMIKRAQRAAEKLVRAAGDLVPG